VSTIATTIEIPVRSVDLDADRVVNNALYFMYFEQARLAHLRGLGVIRRPRPPAEPARSFTIAATEARYLAPTVYPEMLRVSAWTREVRSRSFILAYAAVRVSDGVRVAEGSSAQVWLDAGGQAAPLPAPVRTALVASMGDGAMSAP
jgi:acyl-CoA thioester hydrolase